MRAAFYSPYLDTLGGGERYFLSAAKALEESGWKVDIQGTQEILDKAGKRLGLNLSEINPVKNIRRGDNYDLCFWVSDGSIPRLLARKNILHFQRPFYQVDGKSLLNRMKFYRIDNIVVNSRFTKKWIDQEYPKESVVIYPPVDIESFRPKRKKENLILYVGRFSQLEQNKRQDVLLDAFKDFHDHQDNSWKLVLAGGSDIGRTKYVDELIKSSHSYPVEIMENVPFKTIKELFGKAKIFWSAAGFGKDKKKDPEKLEHFGITVVEAMSAGAVPVIFAAGGHEEIIEDKKNGLLWSKEKELVRETAELIQDTVFMKSLSRKAQEDSKKYSYEEFKKKFISVIQ